MLFQVTRDQQYKKAMEGIKRYLRFVWDAKQGLFYQGAHFTNGQWVLAEKNFALDVQTWSLACIGPLELDAWFGQGTAWRIWQAGRLHSGVFDKQGGLLGVGFSDEHDRISVEWSAGAMVGLSELAAYYKIRHPRWADRLLQIDPPCENPWKNCITIFHKALRPIVIHPAVARSLLGGIRMIPRF